MYYKSVRKDFTSHYDAKTLHVLGQPLVVTDFNPRPVQCAPGLHVSKTLLGAVEMQRTLSIYLEIDNLQTILYDVKDDYKVRCVGYTPIRVIPQEELDTLAGFKLCEANNPINPSGHDAKIVATLSNNNFIWIEQ